VINFTNSGAGGSGSAYVSLTPNFPTKKIIPVDLSSPDVDGKLICQQQAFMASHGDVNINMDVDCNMTRCCCGGMGLVRQKIKGTGTVFLNAVSIHIAFSLSSFGLVCSRLSPPPPFFLFLAGDSRPKGPARRKALLV